MNKLIFRKMHVLIISYTTKCEYSVETYKTRIHRGVIVMDRVGGKGILPSKISRPILLLITGYGVLSKEISGNKEIFNMVHSDDNYLVDISDSIFSFMRKEQISHLLDTLRNNKIRYFPIRLLDNRRPIGQIMQEIIQEFYSTECTVRRLFIPTESSRMIAEYLYKVVRIPILSTLFIVLVINAVISDRFQKKYNELNSEIINYKRKEKSEHRTSEKKRALLEKFYTEPHYMPSRISDWIASIVPYGITLKELQISPRSGNAGKSHEYALNTIIVKGEAESNNEISEMVREISTSFYTKDAVLQSVNYSKRKDLLHFEIEIQTK